MGVWWHMDTGSCLSFLRALSPEVAQGREGHLSITFLIVVTKYPDDLKKEGFILTHSLKKTM